MDSWDSCFEKLCSYLNIKHYQLIYRITRYSENSPLKRDTSDIKAPMLVLLRKEDKTVKVKKIAKFPKYFTSFQQIELIKLITQKNLYVTIEFLPYAQSWYFMIDDINTTQNVFSEALANIVCQLIEKGKLDKEEVKQILEVE